MTWYDLSSYTLAGIPPQARYGHGFTSTGGKLYVHGGTGKYGNVCGWKGMLFFQLDIPGIAD
jgi:hypothetical protein